MKIESVKFSLGWLKDGSETTIDLPQPKQMAYMEPEDLENEKYPAFTDLPVKSKSFSFAGLGSQAHLVSTRKFQDADGKHICSIVKIDCTLSSMEKPDTKINYVACCQPYSQADNAPRGAMTLRFDGIPVPGLLTWSEFLSNGNFTDNKVTNLVAVNGDYPLDDKSKMLLVPNDKSNSSTTQQFAQHFYNWLRNGHSRPRIDSIMTMLNEPFLSAPNQVYTYEFAKDGSINRTVADGTQFARPVSSDGQAIAIADTHIKSGASAVIFFRDNVTTMNTRSGKHGGQPLAGYPLHDSGHNSNSTDSKELTTNFSKRTKYEDGLALDIEIGGTTPSTAMREVLAMRKLANRKI